MDISQFFFTLFDENEATCFSQVNTGTKVFDIDSKFEYASKWAVFFCINPLHPTKDLNPTEEYHKEDRPRRCDKNVVKYRNILIEMDSIPVDEQKEYIEKVGMPYSTAVYSGGKSIHYIISLETPISDEKAYRKLVERIHKALGGKTVVDVACKNPSRFSRFPGALRPDKENKEQTLITINQRVPNEELERWLLAKGVTEQEERPARTIGNKEYNGEFDNRINKNRAMSGFTLNFIMCGAPEGERNLSLFKAACDLFKCGYDEDEVFDRLEGPSGLDRQEVERTIKSAQRKVESEQE